MFKSMQQVGHFSTRIVGHFSTRIDSVFIQSLSRTGVIYVASIV